MKRRGFLTALLGFTAAPLLAKVKAPVQRFLGFKVIEKIGKSRCNPEAIKKCDFSGFLDPEVVMTYDPDIGSMLKRAALGDMIKEAQADYLAEHGNYPNIVKLGGDEYNLWHKGGDEILGHTDEHIPGGTGKEFFEYALAYGMLVYVKTEYTDVKKLNSDEFYQYIVKSHLEVELCTEKVTKDTHHQVLSTVGFKTMKV